MLIGTIQESDIEELEQLFAVRTEQGWVIPEWLEYLGNERACERSQLHVTLPTVSADTI